MSLSINPKFLSGLMTTDQELLNEAQVRRDADAVLQSNIDSEVSDREAAIAAESELREAGDAAEVSARQAAIQALSSSVQQSLDAKQLDINGLRSDVDANALSISSEVSARQLAVQGVQSQIDTEKSRVDAILSASQADKDSFVEIVSLINSVDTTNDQAFAGYASSNDLRVSGIESSLSQEVSSRTSADSALSTSISQEASSRQLADADLQSQVDSLDGYAQDIRTDLDNLDGYAQDIRTDVDALQSSVSSESSARQLADQALESRIDAILFAADEDKNSFAEISSLIQSTRSSLESSIGSEVSARQLAVQGVQSQIDTEKSRVDAILSASQVDKDSFAEIVTLINSIDTANNEGFASYAVSNNLRVSEVESDLAQEVSDRQSAVQGVQSSLSQEVLDRQSADSSLGLRLQAIEDRGFSNGSVTVAEELGYIDLNRQYTKLMSVAIGRLAIHEGEDYTVTVVDGKTRLTWINSLAVGGDQAVQAGDRIFFVGAY